MSNRQPYQTHETASDKLIIQKQTRNKYFTMLNVTPETKEQIRQVSTETGVPMADVTTALVKFGIDHLVIINESPDY